MIYEYTLAVEQPVTCIPYEKKDRRHQRLIYRTIDSQKDEELNQMKFVCRQMYEETSTLGSTGSSCLRFQHSRKKCGSSLCCRSLEFFTMAQIESLRTIHITEGMPYRARSFSKQLFDVTGMQKLVHFSRTHPGVKTIVYLKFLDIRISPYSLVDVAEVIHWIARKQEPNLWPRANDYLIDKVMRHLETAWEGYGKNAEPFPDNLRFGFAGSHDEKTWRAIWRRMTFLNHYQHKTVPSWRSEGF